MHSPLSLAVGYNRVVTHGRRSCNNVVAILAKDRLPRCSEARCRTPATILSWAALVPLRTWRGPSLCVLSALRAIVCDAIMTTPGGARATTYSYTPPCSAHRLLSWVGAPMAPTLRGSGPSLRPLFWRIIPAGDLDPSSASLADRGGAVLNFACTVV